MKTSIGRRAGWAATGVGVVLLAGAATVDRNRGREVPAGSNVGVGQTIEYLVRREEWGSSPNYCAVARRFELTPNQIVAMRYLNGANNQCADPLSIIPIGQRVHIPLAEMPASTCKAARSSC